MTTPLIHKRIEFSPIFKKKLKRVNVETKTAFREALELFLEDTHGEKLRNHTLRGKYAGVHSIDVTEDFRALYREDSERIVFVELGTHNELYR
jgi:addiction module RelE/StbE family toxin